jgi:hypothetical protein
MRIFTKERSSLPKLPSPNLEKANQKSWMNSKRNPMKHLHHPHAKPGLRRWNQTMLQNPLSVAKCQTARPHLVKAAPARGRSPLQLGISNFRVKHI